MGVEVQGLRVSLRLASLEYDGANGMKHALGCQRLHRAFALVVGVDLYERLWPVAAILVLALDFSLNVGSGNADKAA